MNVTKVTGFNIYFKGKIIDAHAHVGKHDGKLYTKDNLDVFVKSALPNNDTVEKMILSDLDVLHSQKGEYEGNKEALDLFKNNDKYALIASCNPKDGDIKNIEKLFKNYPKKFVGLKFHSDIQNLDLANKKYEPYMDFASKNDLPCLFHSCVNTIEDGKLNLNSINISDPQSIYNLAKKYPKTPVVMAHMGAGWKEAHDKAIDILVESVKNGDANLYADISWVDIDHEQTHVVKAIKRLKGIGEKDWKYGDQSFRLMFGTDAPLSRFQKDDSRNVYSDFVEKIKTCIRNDRDLKPNTEQIIDDLFFNNAKNLYLSNRKRGKLSSCKYLIFGAIAAVIGLGGYVLYKAGNNKTQNN